MAMLIKTFNKLSQSKVLLYVVFGVIVISFVGFFTPTLGSRNKQEEVAGVLGTMFGEDVTRDQYRGALRNTKIWYILSSGRLPEQDRETLAAMSEQAWVRLAMLHKAGEEGFVVSDQEVIDMIQRLPLFRGQSGVFDKAAYQAILGQIGITPGQVENVMREQVAIHKLMIRPMQAALISPEELNRAYHMYTDRMVLEYAVLPRETVAEEVSVSREEAEAFFADNREMFRMPAKVRVSYVEFPVADYLAQAEEVPEEVALDAYNRNIERYRIESTNETDMVEYQPFEEVQAEIVQLIKEGAARRMAVEQATALVAEIAPKGQDEQPDFHAAVERAGLSTKTLPAFGPNDRLPGIDPTAPFKRAALGLNDDAFSSFSDAVPGKDRVYVISLEQRYKSFLPDFDIVEEQVMEAAEAQAVRDALAERAQQTHDTLTAVLETGKTFQEAVAPLGLSVETTEEFDLATSFDHPYANQMIAASIYAAEGELCELVPMADGVLFAYVAQRTSSDPEVGLPAVRGELVNGLTSVYAQRLAASWQAALMEEADLQLKQ